MPVDRYLSPAPPRILAHRGLATSAIENTAGAFRAALAAGARFIETDVHVTADGTAVLWHDPDLRRFDGSAERIDRLRWEQLRTRTCGDARIQSLAEALAEFPEASFNIDMKVAEALKPVVAEVDRAGARERVLLTSFADQRRKQAAALLPGVATSAGSAAVMRIVANRFWMGTRRWTALVENALDGAVALQIPRRQLGIPVLTPALITAAHSLGAEVHVWTVNSPVEMTELLDLGVDGLVTDRCDLGLALLQQRAQR